MKTEKKSGNNMPPCETPAYIEANPNENFEVLNVTNPFKREGNQLVLQIGQIAVGKLEQQSEQSNKKLFK